LSAADRRDARIFNLGRNAARPDTPKRIDQIELYNNARGPGRPHAFLRAFRERRSDSGRGRPPHKRRRPARALDYGVTSRGRALRAREKDTSARQHIWNPI
jgi:hypothetical protein